MTAVTLRADGTPLGQKPFTWAYTKLKNYEICPKRHYETDIAKSTEEEDSEHLRWGNYVHKAAAGYFEGKPVPPDVWEVIGKWLAKITNTPGTVLAERKYALTRDLEPCGYFDKGVWYRGVADVLKIHDDVAAAIDWKTGKITSDSVQLSLMAACVFAHHPEVQKIRTEFIWLQEDATTREDFTRLDMPMIWSRLFPRVKELENSYLSGNYPPKPNRLCAMYCKVTSCVHHGKRYREQQ